MYKRYVGIGVIVLGLVVGAVWGFVITAGNRTLAKDTLAKEVFVPGSMTNAKIEKLKAELEQTKEYEKAYGCVENTVGNEKILCGVSKERVDRVYDQLMWEIKNSQKRGDDQMAKVKAAIRAIKEDPLLEVDFNSNFANPFTEKNQKRIESYKDTKGFEYWVDPTNNSIVQFGPGGNSKVTFRENPKLSQKQLRDRVEKYLEKNIQDFASVQKTYVFETGSKGDAADMTYAFRWNAPAPVNGEDMAPFVQVVVSSAGDIKSFSDTRSLYNN
jgi:hypothetical protein